MLSSSTPCLPYPAPSDCWQVFGGGDGSIQVRAIVGANSGQVQVRKVNACGAGWATVKQVNVTAGGGGCNICPIAIVYPNPTTSSELEMTFISKETGEPLDMSNFDYDVKYTLRNMQGKIVHQSKSNRKSKKINLNKLTKNKQYILSINYGNIGQENIHIYLE